MYYISSDTVINAFNAIKGNIKSPFFGVLGLLKFLNTDNVYTNCAFPIKDGMLSKWLDDEFFLDTYRGQYGETLKFIRFSTKWVDEVKEAFIRNTVDIYAVISFIYKYTPFEEEPTRLHLLTKFLNEFHLIQEVVAEWFDNNGFSITFSSDPITKQQLKTGLHLSNDTIKFEVPFYVEARAGELTRGPYFQPLYASIDTVKYMIVSSVDSMPYYPVGIRSIGHKEVELQTIFYGSPGTGKSYILKNEILKDVPHEHIFRTTFHPDSDYASFVGAYKPNMLPDEMVFVTGPKTIDEVVGELKKRYDNAENKNFEIMAFGIEYCKYFNGEICSYSKKDVVDKAIPGTTYDKELHKAVSLAPWVASKCKRKSFAYEFVPQTFTKAYIAAKKDPDNQYYLVIEEINRGNCAQIFGDLFQLLDRTGGVSEYPVKGDADLIKYLNDSGIPGNELCLPANFHILATMNTSDQSLFPIDSAFKRRWDWKYTKICDGKQGYRIVEDSDDYDWWTFIQAINIRIKTATNSVDKQLGYWFVKPTEGKIINADMFASKVIFYLWNDVFKNSGDDDNIFTEDNSFESFFDEKGNAIEGNVKEFVRKIITEHV